MKTVLFVPGFKEDIKTRDYKSTICSIEAKGYIVKFVPICWQKTTIIDWVNELNAVYEKYTPNQTILAGFSFGAMTAFISATKINPYQLWLFSLSPYFAEDLKSKNMKPTWLKQIGKNRVTEFAKLDFKPLSNKVHCTTYLFAGQLEINKWPIMGERLIKASKLLKQSKITIVEGAKHDITDKKYIRSITSTI